MVAWEGGDEKLNMKIYDTEYDEIYDQIIMTAKGKIDTVINPEYLRGYKHLSVATGNFDNDDFADDEVVVVWNGGDDKLNVEVYKVDSNLQFQEHDKDSSQGLHGAKYLDVATGDLDRNGDYEVLVCWEEAGRDFNKGVYDVKIDPETDTLEITYKFETHNERVNGKKRHAIACGDFDGDSIWAKYANDKGEEDKKRIIASLRLISDSLVVILLASSPCGGG